MSSSVSSLKQFGRAWKVSISNGVDTTISFESKAWQPEALHISFETTQSIRESYWYCDLVIYNLNAPTEQGTILQGMQLTLEAGYQSQPYGTIFAGTIFQPMWEVENGVDYKLTLHCLCGLVENTRNFLALTIAEGKSQRELIAQMATAFRNKIDGTDVHLPEGTKQSRASTYFGAPNDFLGAVADDNNSNLWFSDMAFHIRELAQATTLPTTTYSVDSGLIGTPQMTQEGVMLRVLMDPRLIIRGQIKLDQSVLVKQFPRILNNSYPTILAQSGTYLVGMIRHYGDSRGNEWYSEITAFLNAASLLAIQTAI